MSKMVLSTPGLRSTQGKKIAACNFAGAKGQLAVDSFLGSLQWAGRRGPDGPIDPGVARTQGKQIAYGNLVGVKGQCAVGSFKGLIYV